MIGEQIYLNEENKILKETDYYIIIKPKYPEHSNRPLVYKKVKI